MVEIAPLSGALGSGVTGVDWTQPVADATIAVIRDALLKTHLVCLRTQPLAPRAFARLARHFGEPQLQLLRNMRIDDVPEVSLFDSTYKRAADKPADLRLDRRSGWHTDDSYFTKSAKITLLQALEVPDTGGETGFCNARAAYEDLTEAMKAKLNGLRRRASPDPNARRDRPACDLFQLQPDRPDRGTAARGKRCAARPHPCAHDAGPLPVSPRVASR